MNYSPVDRDSWRIKAFIDRVGKPATSRLLVVRPTDSGVSLECLWAICNSPLANAYTFALGTKRDILVGMLRDMRVPDFSRCAVSLLNAAVREYLAAATKFTSSMEEMAAKTKRRAKPVPRSHSARHTQLAIPLPGVMSDEEINAAKERLRALHWRVDAEVLRLYALPPNLERMLLDAFDGVKRVGVPFEQTRYIPRDFRDVQTLDEFLRITDEWDKTDERRCALIEKRIKAGKRTPDEEREFRELQRLLMLRRRLVAPLPLEELRAALKETKKGAASERVKYVKTRTVPQITHEVVSTVLEDAEEEEEKVHVKVLA